MGIPFRLKPRYLDEKYLKFGNPEFRISIKPIKDTSLILDR